MSACGRCLVHCNAGRSRAATVVAAILMLESVKESKSNRLTAAAALEQVKAARPSICPNLHFRQVLLNYEEHLKNAYVEPGLWA